MSDLEAIPFQFMTSYDNTASVGIAVVDQLHNFDLEECGKVPVVPGLSVVEELEESERESTEISPGRWWSSFESATGSPMCRENYALTGPTRNSFSRLIFIALN